MSEREDDLRATVEDLDADAKDLQAIEEEKAALDLQDPRMVELSDEGERLAREMVTKAGVERGLVEEANGSGESSESNELDESSESENGRERA